MSRSRRVVVRASRWRRGSVYIAVLGASLVVTILGFSALVAVRIQRRALHETERAVRARFSAQSLVDVVLLEFVGNSAWRTTHTHDTWTAPQIVGDAETSYKLVDELDGNLSNDATQPVRLYAKAKVADAERICSVLLEPSSKPNLLDNGDMEHGTTNWSGRDHCDLESYADGPHGGVAYIWVKNRDYSWAGPNQDITKTITNGTTYSNEIWAKMKDFDEPVRITYKLRSSGEGTRWLSGSATTVGMAWTRVSATITPTWSGTLDYAYWFVETGFSTQEFKVDDAVLTDLSSEPPMVPVPGTWRQEVLP